MGEFSTSAWHRFGHDRTYVVDSATGLQIGYRDNTSGALVPTDPSTARVLARWAGLDAAGVLAPIAASGSTPQPQEPVTTGPIAGGAVTTPLAPLPTVLSADEDLAGRRPGHAARMKAESELAALRADRGRFRTWLGRVVDEKTDERAWRVGASGEATIGRELDGLQPLGWRVLHSVPVGEQDSDIDHVLIGPGGVFTVNSKHHPGARVWVVSRQIRVNNQPVPYLRNSRHEATRAERLLSRAAGFRVPVTSVLIFRLGGGALTIREDPGDVLVYRATKAARRLRDRHGVLTDAHVEAVFAAARWRSTWQPGRGAGQS